MQIRLKSGRLVRRRFTSSPFGGKVSTDAETQDDRDWNSFISDQRELRDDPFFDPMRFNDGTSITDWQKNARNGL